MILQAFAIFDSAVGAFMEPFFAQTIEVAIRRFRSTVNHAESDMSRYPNDYSLFHVGSFEQESGMFQPLNTPHNLGLAIQFMEKTDAE